MSGINEVVHQALSESPMGRQAIAEATGLELAQVSGALTYLRSQALAERVDDGWVAGGGQVAKRRVHAAPAPDSGSSPAAAKRKNGRGRRANGNGHAAPTGGNGGVAFATFGEYVVIKRSDLTELMTVIARWQAVIETMV